MRKDLMLSYTMEKSDWIRHQAWAQTECRRERAARALRNAIAAGQNQKQIEIIAARYRRLS